MIGCAHRARHDMLHLSWSQNKLLHVLVEDVGFVGCVSINSNTVLAELRQVIESDIAHGIPLRYRFVLNGSPITGKQEHEIKAVTLSPTVELRATFLQSAGDVVVRHAATARKYVHPGPISSQFTFRDLRVDACRF